MSDLIIVAGVGIAIYLWLNSSPSSSLLDKLFGGSSTHPATAVRRQ